MASDPKGTLAPFSAGAGLSLVSLALVLAAPRSLADVVTVFRAAAVIALVLATAWIGDLSWWTWALLVGAAACDLLDGALARRFGASARGAMLDMESDQLTVLSLSWLVVAGGGGVHVLLLPALRYAFVIGAWLVGIPAVDPKPVNGDNRRGRLICAVVFVALLLALMPGMPRVATDVFSGAAALLLSWSFAQDWAYLFAMRRAGVES